MKPLIRRTLVAVTLIVGSMTGLAPTAAATGTTYVIGVDNAGPAGHDYEYVDFFPRAAVSAHRGDVLDFKWNTATLDGLHTAALVPTGFTAPGLIAPEFDEGFQLGLSPTVLEPSVPNCGASQINPCTYDASAILNSGAKLNSAGGDFYVKLNVSPGQVNFVCLIHAGMQGSVTVVADSTPASTVADVQAAADAQLASDTLGARIVEAKAESRSVTTNPDGTHTVTMTAGTATPFVEVVEMLPRKVEVRPFDTVTWVTKTIKDPHTVTFPQGAGSDALDPLPSFCEGSPDTRAPLAFPVGLPTFFGCASPADAEVHLVPQPIGGTVISSTTTAATSGVITNPPGPPGPPDRYSFSFPNAGTFAYQCLIHDHMAGTVMVVPRR